MCEFCELGLRRPIGTFANCLAAREPWRSHARNELQLLQSLPGQTPKHQRVGLFAQWRDAASVTVSRPHEAAGVQPTGRAPHTEAVVHEQLDALARALAKTDSRDEPAGAEAHCASAMAVALGLYEPVAQQVGIQAATRRNRGDRQTCLVARGDRVGLEWVRQRQRPSASLAVVFACRRSTEKSRGRETPMPAPDRIKMGRPAALPNFAHPNDPRMWHKPI